MRSHKFLLYLTKMPQLHKLKCTAYNIPNNRPTIDVQEWILKENMLVYISTKIKHAGKSTKQSKNFSRKSLRKA